MKRSKYRLLGLVGQGQFGQVFCALHRSTGQLVALKNLEHDRFPTHKFLRELRFLLSLQHPNIVTCRALEHTSTGRYLVMDYCEGGTLRGLMAEDYRLSLSHAVRLVENLLLGLDHAHSRGIVHCDIKPENILVQLSQSGWIARISDFGIARLSQEIRVQEGATGSPAYMAPERFYGQFSAASDLYSVGILLFELMTGYRPFSGTPAELRSAHLNRPLQLPDCLPPVWQPIIAKALQKLPGRRYRSAAEMLAALKLARAELPESPDLPLYFTVTASPDCRFEPVSQRPIEQKVSCLAAAPAQLPWDGPPSERLEQFNATCIWQAAAAQLEGWGLRAAEAREAGEAMQLVQLASYAVSAAIERLWMRPQGCFVVTKQSLAWVSHPELVVAPTVRRQAESQAEIQAESQGGIEEISRWHQDQTAAIDPAGNWVALLSQDSQTYELGFRTLPAATYPLLTLAPAVTGQTGHQLVDMLALNSRHLGLFWRSQDGRRSTAELMTRRGNRLGVLDLPLRLQQISLTPHPYRLLAVDDCPGTVLLLDLKPYRIRRLWVEISPQFLLATGWGYILAEASGRLVFLDQSGQQIGRLSSPPQITALALRQNQLWIAIWNSGQGMIYSLDLHQLGLDLVF